MKKIIISLLLLLPAIADAQIYELAERNNPWNQGQNINGLRNDSTTVSYAELYGGYESGEFRRFSDAPSSWKAGLIAESMLHLDRMSMKGMFAFEHEQSYNACGSMFVRQDYYPINPIEFTPGSKIRQRYAFDGGLAYELTGRWRIGGKLAFTSMNYSKRKDLRYRNYLLDLSLTPSVQYHTGDFSIGLSYILQKNSESVKASQIGKSATEYKVFLDKGLTYGTYENWEGNGVHLKESGVEGLPIKEILNGFAIQFGWKDLYLDAEYMYAKGKAGEKDFIWFEFPSHHAKFFLNWNLVRPHAIHHFRLGYRFRQQNNFESTLVKENEGGVSNVHKYSSNNIFSREEHHICPEYELVAKKWRLRWYNDINLTKELSSQIFPYICTGLQNGFQTSLEGKVHLWKFELGANLGFARNKITVKERTVSESGMTKAPVRIDEYTDRWLCYERAPKLETGLSLRYNFWKGLYLEMSGQYLRAFSTADNKILPTMLAHPERWDALLKLGVNF